MIETYSKQVEIRWSDLDPNFHVRHSVYYDFGAYVRMCFLTEYGLSPAVLMQQHLGPILFKEECVFKREVHFGDHVAINLKLIRSTTTYSRWSIQHEVIKNNDTIAAVITVEGAWIDTAKRKLTVPSAIVTPTFELMPKSESFEWGK